MLTLRVKAPTNAYAFRGRVKVLTSDYPESVCGQFVDQFLVLLESGYVATGNQSPNPTDMNIAAFAATALPLNANLAFGNTGHFEACMNGSLGCGAGSSVGTYSACTSTSSLMGTGFDQPSSDLCNVNPLIGGATGWLEYQGNIVPGETFTLRFALWDTGDGDVDTTAVIDAFEWLPGPIVPGLIP